ncbi:NADH-quinone oxidoreductase subunit K [Bradyrhizobium sp. SSUT77]|uniref:NADH-quinone oxidoreductase subunit K n=1 Tax=Bradyrhizobium sp. SSUT77 TaxID=3040603 RepID=UPI00244AD0C8|nr:NADH-quinone oxidoreductase subunit K [Bradyrhizobium sp. SSUT77]MDH2349029.1 NADH-quinone oxidoreductase subunit K [Bradyrhizobium sp. SSUT77]
MRAQSETSRFILVDLNAQLALRNDPVPQALVITGIVVAFSATALAIALLLRLFQTTASPEPSSRVSPGDDPDQAGS